MDPAEVRHRIYGVDFSGSKTACKKIWISEAFVQEGKLRILRTFPIGDLVNGKKKDRDACLKALRELISGSEKSVFGMDFPFSLPRELLFTDTWESFVSGFADRYSSPEQFRNQMRTYTQNKELKRLTDSEVKAPFCVYNLRLYRQTYYGIRDVLGPLLEEESACMIPMHRTVEDKPWLMEICPASTLKNEGLYIPYKGKSPEKKRAREYILAEMQERGITMEARIRELIIGNTDGDALDSMIAAFATSRAIPGLENTLKTIRSIYLLEGYTFF
ncbi:DUF429 domain-containing protein [Methanolobus zinderi]|jgi:hypothetical protein|uniref:DUF429 domain-containing protein n=1 Tax=Methanolobus zinderi TaxID=536044 RepID=A0A7D5IQZ1_9EURY|nr:DUF429 domain-containing protein [Methanolobus zinderi]QLC50887.1 DUF429 domain-containing protein [Methanolobus zinderi]